MRLIHGDCIEVMAAMEPESVDAIVTDPPYGIRFMGKAWDGADIEAMARRLAERHDRARARGKSVPHSTSPAMAAGQYDLSLSGNRAFQTWTQQWAEAAYRVAKPSAYLLAFGGTRTVHRMTVALEDAGWIIRDMLVWGYASGFPKSKASLKPAWEPIVMARKPGPLRMLAIDECRIGTGGEPLTRPNTEDAFAKWSVDGGGQKTHHMYGKKRPEKEEPAGRWPANVVLTDPIFDGGVEGVVGGGSVDGEMHNQRASSIFGTETDMERATVSVKDSGTYSRFFLIPKADRADREPVLGGLPLGEHRSLAGGGSVAPGRTAVRGQPRQRANVHPTVKPTDLMRHLVRLVTPPGGVVLDPFLGSGTTALAAEMEGFEWIGIEREAEYVAIAEARLNGTQRGLGLGA